MWEFLVLLATAWLASAADVLPPSCDKRVYCNSDLLHFVQMSRIYNDSKTFVDLQLKYDENKTLTDFDTLLKETNRDPTKEQIREFVDKYFSDEGELEKWQPPDFNKDPPFLYTLKDKTLREFAKSLNNIWTLLSRKVKQEVLENPERYSLIPLTHGFIIPGGRFTEIYYWDTYWIIEGLLITGMQETAKGMIENLIELLIKFGHIPNGSRCYYQERSQPPVLTDMFALYYKYTNDVEFLRNNIQYLEKEIDFWLDQRAITFEKDGKSYTLLRYHAPSEGPRPESYFEDYNNTIGLTEEDRTDFYVDTKSAAESGWDFSTRWFLVSDGSNNGTLSDLHTRYIIPVDLNSIIAGALQHIANFHTILKNSRKAAAYAEKAKQFKDTIEAVHWNEEDGIWYDYDVRDKIHRKYFYSSNVAPLWQRAVNPDLLKERASKIVDYLKQSGGVDFPGGVPTSLIRSGEQWDFPNVWPPEMSIVVNGIQNIGTSESDQLAFEVAQTFVRSCHLGFQQYKQMFEKYDAEVAGRFGGGGEYNVQFGFGWANGVVLEFMKKYSDRMTADDSAEVNCTTDAPDPSNNSA